MGSSTTVTRVPWASDQAPSYLLAVLKLQLLEVEQCLHLLCSRQAGLEPRHLIQGHLHQPFLVAGGAGEADGHVTTGGACRAEAYHDVVQVKLMDTSIRGGPAEQRHSMMSCRIYGTV